MGLKVVSKKRARVITLLAKAAKERNSVRSAIRACVEYVFGCMTTSMGSKLTRKIGLERNEA